MEKLILRLFDFNNRYLDFFLVITRTEDESNQRHWLMVIKLDEMILHTPAGVPGLTVVPPFFEEMEIYMNEAIWRLSPFWIMFIYQSLNIRERFRVAH